MRKNAARSVDRSPTADAVPEQRYPQPDPQAFAAALAEAERELAGRRLSADGTLLSEAAIRRSTAWARALRRRGWPTKPVPYGPQPWADVDFLDEDGEPIDYSDAPELPPEAWAKARPNTLYADLWEADLARRVAGLARDRREALGLTQEQVAERTGLPQSSVSRVETGRHLPSVSTLARLAVALRLAWRLDVTPGGAQVMAAPAEPAVTGKGEGTASESSGRRERETGLPSSHLHRLLVSAFPDIATDPSSVAERDDCWVAKVLARGLPADMDAGLSAALDIVARHGQSDRLTKRIRAEHPVRPRRGHLDQHDQRVVDCLTEACAFAWADAHGLVPSWDFGTGAPDVRVAPDHWIEAKSIRSSGATRRTWSGAHGGMLTGPILDFAEENRLAAFEGHLADALEKASRLPAGARLTLFINEFDSAVSAMIQREAHLAAYRRWADAAEAAHPNLRLILCHNFAWRTPHRDAAEMTR